MLCQPIDVGFFHTPANGPHCWADPSLTAAHFLIIHPL